MSLDGRVGYDEVLNQVYSDREKSRSSGRASVSMTWPRAITLESLRILWMPARGPELNATRPTSQSSFPPGDEQALMELVRKVPRGRVMTALRSHMGETKLAR